jgi:hypothetical protein
MIALAEASRSEHIAQVLRAAGAAKLSAQSLIEI